MQKKPSISWACSVYFLKGPCGLINLGLFGWRCSEFALVIVTGTIAALIGTTDSSNCNCIPEDRKDTDLLPFSFANILFIMFILPNQNQMYMYICIKYVWPFPIISRQFRILKSAFGVKSCDWLRLEMDPFPSLQLWEWMIWARDVAELFAFLPLMVQKSG